MSTLSVACFLTFGLSACGGASETPNLIPPGSPTAVQIVAGPTAPGAPNTPAVENPVPTPAGSSPAGLPSSPASPPSSTNSSSTPPSVPQLPSTAQAPGNPGSGPQPVPASARSLIEALEKSGAVPALDRSSDIKGPDVNANGVRDDIEAYINRLQLSPAQRKAAMQNAKALQMTLTVDTADKAAVQRVGETTMAAINCLSDNFEETHLLSGKIEAMTANTRERAKRYLAYNAARSGSVTELPNRDTCEK